MRWLYLVFAILLYGVGHAASAAVPLPPLVPDRIGRAQIFMWKVQDARTLVGKRDVIWGATGPSQPGLYMMAYMPGDRDFDGTHDLAWYRANHPGWIVDKCGSGDPAWEFGNTRYVPIDVGQPAVRAFHWQSLDRPLLQRTGYPALAIDNIDIRNVFGRCPASANGHYAHQPDDPLFARDTALWMDWLGNQVHSTGHALAVNLTYSGVDRTGFLRASSAVDIVVDEHGFVRKCVPMDLGAKWEDRISLWRTISRRKALIVIDQLCAREDQITPAVLDWSLASYLMVKGDRTYISMVAEDGYDGRYVARSILDLPIGAAQGEPARAGGVWVRRFARAIAIVNPSGTQQAFPVPAGWRLREGGAPTPQVLVIPAASAAILVR